MVSIIVIAFILAVASAGVVVWFCITIAKTFRKFDSLDILVKHKLLRMDNYMVYAGPLTKDELIRLSALPDDARQTLNAIHDRTEKVKMARNILLAAPAVNVFN